MASTPLPLKIILLAGQIVLAAFYGTLGTIATFFQLLRIGPKRFFARVARPVPPAVATDPVYGKHELITLKSTGVKLHFVSKGSADQPLMLFLHGFPECWYTWRNQMTYFSRNYRVVAIDQRGYGLSAKPSGVANYKLTVLARDVVDVVQQLGHKSCVLVGHDWGGIIAWATSILYPEVVNRLIIMNAPHLGAFRQQISLTQLRRSWYIFFYQVPFIPELLIQSNDFGILKRIFLQKPMGLVNPGNMTLEDFDVFRYTFSQPGTVTAALNYYRALVRYQDDELLGRVTMPVLIVWGCQDMALGEELSDASTRFCNNARLKKIPGASHWVQQDRPDEVNRYMEEFLKETSTM